MKKEIKYAHPTIDQTAYIDA